MVRKTQLFGSFLPIGLIYLSKAVYHGRYNRFDGCVFGEKISFGKQVPFEGVGIQPVLLRKFGAGGRCDKVAFGGQTGFFHQFGNLVDIESLRDR